jgi:outer membrane protein assembly factor BamB
MARFTDGSGDVLIAGCQIPLKGKCQAYSRRYSSEGKLIWTQEFRKSSSQGGTCARAATIDSDNNVYLSGWTRADLFGTNNGTGNMFIVSFDGMPDK